MYTPDFAKSESSTPPTTFHGWSRLPDELKVKILAHNIVHSDAINDNTHELRLHFVTELADSKNAEDNVEA
jgi:hypothetical protein